MELILAGATWVLLSYWCEVLPRGLTDVKYGRYATVLIVFVSGTSAVEV